MLLAEDHAIVIEGLRQVLQPECEIVGEVADGRALVAAVEKLRPDVIIADISMPLLNGIEAARQIRKIDSKVKIIFLTMHPDVTYAAEALLAGGSGYVLKSAAGRRILEALRQVMNGQIYVTPSIDREVLEAQMERVNRRDSTQFELTPRQREVLQLIVEGRSSKEVAEILHVSPRTVEFHKYRMMEALGLRSTAELVQYAVKHGIISH
ncbi:MAG TPA: response regulator transcription factor [Bryobacteraceae bacterium]